MTLVVKTDDKKINGKFKIPKNCYTMKIHHRNNYYTINDKLSRNNNNYVFSVMNITNNGAWKVFLNRPSKG